MNQLLNGRILGKLTLVTSLQGCKDSITKKAAIVYPGPVAGFTAEPKIASIWEPKIKFINTSTGVVKWMWHFGDQDSTSVQNQILHTYRDTGRYQVCLNVESEKGCKAKLCDDVLIRPDWTFFVPNTFTPNADGINDHFSG